MKKSTCILTLAALAAVCLTVLTAASGRKEAKLRLLYWNIQNGMWDGQPDHYDRFVAWVKAQHPDICVWCEAATIFKDGTDDYMPDEDHYLPAHWSELARRYGHKYVFLGGWRDDYPQVITSRYPIEEVARITGNTDTLVCHGAGWARIRVHGKVLNLVTLHTWPQAYGFRVPVEDRERSKAAREGDYYRRTEMEYICRHTIGTILRAQAEGEYWMMMGDFNSRSRVDNWVYHYPDDDSRLLVHDYIHAETPYLDLVHERHPNDFYTTTGGRARIDYIYCTRPLFDCVVSDRIVSDDYTTPVRNPQKISNFWHPSDHRPIVVDFNLNTQPRMQAQTTAFKNTRWRCVLKTFVADVGTSTETYTLEFLSDNQCLWKVKWSTPDHPAMYMNPDGTVDTIPGRSSEYEQPATWQFDHDKLTLRFEDGTSRELLYVNGRFTGPSMMGGEMVFEPLEKD